MGTQQFAASLHLPVSRTRLEAYRTQGADELDMVVNYFFNIELSESLYPCLQAFEVALRNTVHATVSDHLQNDRWYDIPGFLGNWQRRQVQGAKTKLDEKGRPHEPGRVVAALTFGFWCSMFNDPFDSKLWFKNQSTALLVAAFPNVPRRFRYGRAIGDRCDVIRELRNRVFHYEPVWSDPGLAKKQFQTLDALGWISRDMMAPVALSDRFAQVHQTGRGARRAEDQGAPRHPLTCPC